MARKIKETFENIKSDPVNFVAKRLPNIEEVLISSASQATIDTFTGRFKTAFGDNPTASAITRDISKVPTIYANIYNNNSLGYTDIVYDEGAVFSHTSKVMCKISVILSSTALTSIETEDAGRCANYLCEIPNRFLNIVSRERQREEKFLPDELKSSYLQYLVHKSKASWWTEASAEAIIKTTTSDQLGELVKYVGYIQAIRAGANVVDNVILTFLGGTIPFEEKDDIYSKAFKSAVNFGFNIYDPRIPMVVVSTTFVDWTAKFVAETINAYALGTLTRGAQDFTGIVIREQMEHYYANATLAGETDKAE